MISNLFLAYLRDKTNYKDDCYGIPSQPILDKNDPFHGPNSSKAQISNNSYLTSERINLVEPQQLEQSGFVGESGQVSYDEGLSWHPIQPLNDSHEPEELNVGLSSFDPLERSGGRNVRGLFGNSGRRDPEGGVTNAIDCDIDTEDLVALNYLDAGSAVPENYSGPVMKDQGEHQGHELENGFAGITDNLLMEHNLDRGYPQRATENNLQGKAFYFLI